VFALGCVRVCAAPKRAKQVNLTVSLRSVVAAHNQVGDFGATHLAAMLRTNSGLTDLNLAHNDLRDNGIRELCSAIVENERLRTFRVVDNPKMGTDGIKALTTLQKSMALSRKLRVYF